MTDPTTFSDDESGYRAWIAAHPTGFVVNSFPTPTRRSLILHRATCYAVERAARGTLTSGSTVKLCGDREAIEAWARRKWGTTNVFKTCSKCGS